MAKTMDFARKVFQLENYGMPVRAKPFEHQVMAFRFACEKLGLGKAGEVMRCNISKNIGSNANDNGGGVALLMEMG